jgi:Transcriptional regulator, AbiEi antitoxin
MTRPLPEPLTDLLAIQRGVITAAQASAAGISATVIKARVRQGRWQRIYPGVYAAFSGELGREARLWAGLLSAGPGAMLSHQSAAELDGLADSRADAIHVTIAKSRRVTPRPGIVLHRSNRAAEAVHPARLPPRTRIEETVLDLVAASTTLDDAAGWLTKALGRRLTTRDGLRRALAGRTRIRWRKQLDELLSPDMAGVLSPLEYRYVRHVERPHGLPRGSRQVVARVDGRRQYRDVLYRACRLVVELDGELAHPAESRRSDSRRDNAAMAEHGLTTLRYTWLDITARPCQTAAQIAAVLARRGYAGARPCRAGCPVGQARSECTESAGSAALRNRRAG